jgi:thioester reductase-like protein
VNAQEHIDGAADDATQDAIAIVSLAGRFPGAPTIEKFWENLRQGTESMRLLTQEELAAAGVPEQERTSPRYVPVKPALDDIAGFDAGYFGMSPREAALIDPQQRLFLELCVELLERAGAGPGETRKRMGVFGGVSKNTYLFFNLLSHPELSRSVGAMQTLNANDKDYLATRVSHKLGLRGPALTVQTACSSSLAAVHLACQSLLSGETDYAIAGGVAVDVPHLAGYLYEPGGILSPDGHCRAFDAEARGTVFGQGGGAVLLRRLADAIADGDDIHAVIRGSAVNNDGEAKAGFTAPSVEGQSAVIVEALANAGVDAAAIGYVEAHGTGTALGDPIEVEALTQAFRIWTDQVGFCRIGSVKTNIGHLNAASGIAGLIKTVLALRHGEIPPSLHYNRPNPAIPFEETPFEVAAELGAWPDGPRLAGVSSFGIGGTNAHVVLEAAPVRPTRPADEGWQLIPLSARTPAALTELARDLGEALDNRSDLQLADVAYTHQTGRRRFAHRTTVVARDRQETAHALRKLSARKPPAATERPEVVFLFPGQGTQYPEMARGLYEREPVFRKELGECGEVLAALGAADPRRLLRPDTAAEPDVHSTETAQPLLFSVEYALSRLWATWGVTPDLVAGHSLGEVTAACVAGVLDRDDALRLVAARARLMGAAPDGAMLAVACSLDELPAPLPPGVEVAAVNTSTQLVLSGAEPGIEQVARILEGAGVKSRRMPGRSAFHSQAMERAGHELAEAVPDLRSFPPSIGLVSNLTGRMLPKDEVIGADYWGRQLRNTVRFSDCAGTLLAAPGRVFLEVGPGRTLGSFLLGHSAWSSTEHQVCASLPGRAGSGTEDRQAMLSALGSLWEAGVEPQWETLHELRPRPVALPTYPFERSRHWIDPALPRPVDGPAAPQLPAAPEPLGAEAGPASEQPTSAASGTRLSDTLQQVISVFEDLLGVAAVAPDDDFFALGGHSMLGVELTARLREVTGVELPLTAVFDRPIPTEVAQLVDAAQAHGVDEAVALGGVDSADDIYLEADLQPRGKVADRTGPATVLLTGASGFLGNFLLHELLRQTQDEVVCLIRCRDAASGLERLRAGLRRYGLLEATDLSRVRVVPGDISRDNFGLEPELYDRLAREVSVVYHNGAKVSFLEPYRLIRRTNVKAAREALRFCAQHVLKPLHHVSTIAVFDCDKLDHIRIAGEDEDLTAGGAFHGGYDESKWVAEQILGLARERGFPVTIYRPGNIAGHSETGAVSDGHLVSAMIKGCVTLGLAPDTDAYVDVVPVDYVSRALVHLSLQDDSTGRNFNLTNPTAIRWRTIAQQLIDAGYPLELVPLEEWREAIRARGDEDNPMRVFLPMLDERALFSGRRYRCTRVLSQLAGTGISCPPLDDRLTGTYIRGLVEAGELIAPPRAHQSYVD